MQGRRIAGPRLQPHAEAAASARPGCRGVASCRRLRASPLQRFVAPTPHPAPRAPARLSALPAADHFTDRTDVQCLHRWQKVRRACSCLPTAFPASSLRACPQVQHASPCVWGGRAVREVCHLGPHTLLLRCSTQKCTRGPGRKTKTKSSSSEALTCLFRPGRACRCAGGVGWPWLGRRCQGVAQAAAAGRGCNLGKGRGRPFLLTHPSLPCRLVAQHGPQKWTIIAEHLPGRIGKQCRER